MENSISLPLAIKCFCCKQGIINEKFTLETSNYRSNGIVGPGFRGSYDKVIRNLYYCDNCGINLIATVRNKFAEKHNERLEEATRILENTYLVIFKNDLIRDFVVANNNSEFIFKAQDFKKGVEVRCYNDNFQPRHESIMDDNELPYIVPGDTTSRLVYWSKCKTIMVPNSANDVAKAKKELKEFRKSSSSKQNLGVTELMLRLRSEGNISTSKTIQNETLPKTAVPAIKIYHPTLKNDLYIPKDAIEVIRN